MKKVLYNLTNPQKNIIELQNVSSENEAVTHIFATLRLKGNLDTDLLQKTLNIILQKNDVFKLHFEKKGSDFFQYYSEIPERTFEVKKFDSEDISEYVEYYKRLPLSFDLLVSFSIVLTPKYTYIFYKTHHIIADGWSMTKVSEQIKEIYTKLLNGESLDNYTKPAYLDFINREHDYLNSKHYMLDSKFWEDYVSYINSNKIFSSYNVFNKNSNRLNFSIPKNISAGIDTFCNSNGITEYTFFLAIFAIYFSKIYSRDSLVFGTPFLNRQKKYGEMECAGLFVSTLPLNINVAECSSFVELCKNIASSNFSIYKHCHFPYHKIQSFYNNSSNDNSNLYEIGFSYQVNELEYKMPNGDTGDFCWYFLNTQNNPLTIHLTLPNHERLLSYDYWTSCFSKEDIIQMNEIIFHIINQVLSGTVALKQLNLLPEFVKPYFNNLFNFGTLPNCNFSVIDMFSKMACKFPDNTAIVCGNNSITYEDLAKKINRLANFLIQKGIKKGSPVALFFDKSIDMIVSMFAVMQAGGCYVPILPDENESRIKYILSDCNPFCILTNSSVSTCIDVSIPIYNLDVINLSETINTAINILPEDVAYIIYTSGSTGNPKGTMVMHKNICSLMYSISKDPILHASSQDVSMSLLKYSFDASGIDIYTALLFGGKLVLVEKHDELNPMKVLEIIEKHKVTRSFLIPKWLEHIALENMRGIANLSSLRILGSGGETLKPNTISSLLNAYPNLKILNLYGPTEATMFTTCKMITTNEVSNNYTSIGRPIYGARLAVVNSNFEILPPNVKGELIIYEDDNSITNIAKGYLNLPEQTTKKFVRIFHPFVNKDVHAYRTGDLAKINFNGEIEFLGRDDDVVKVNGGYLVALNEVENKIQNLLGDNFDTYPIAVPFKNTKIIVLFIVKKEKNINLYNVKNYINNNISFYMRPKKIIELKNFPRNSSGKIDRKKLLEYAKDYISHSMDTIVAPTTKTEKNILSILKKFVNLETISVTDDFIDDLGIDSLALTSFYSSLNQYPITIQDIYNNSNIKDLAYFIDNKNSATLLKLDLSHISDAVIKNDTKPFSLECVLITGVTGYLGIHLLKNLLLNKDTKKIYCVIRNKINLSGDKRLASMIKFYFSSDSNLIDLIKEKVTILNGDITKEYLGLDISTYEHIKSEVTAVINSAANVRHFVKPTQIRKDNVESVDNLIKFCSDKISLAHISTLSIVGFKGNAINENIFDEDSLYIHQNLDNNPYLISKFEAEKNILCAIQKSGLNANIFRVGNIMPRLKDGVFQKNAKQNVFLSALKFIVDYGMIPFDFMSMPLELSPVDECSDFVFALLKENLNYTIYHIANSNIFTFSDFKKLLLELGISIKCVDEDNFMQALGKYTNEYTKEYLLASNLNSFSLDRTVSNLNSIGLHWKPIDIEYIKFILNLLRDKF